MSLSGTLSNFAGGVMLLIFKPFKSGDFIEAQGVSGIVHEKNIVDTKLYTVDNKMIAIPNGTLFNGTINNFTKCDTRRVDITLPMRLGTNIGECCNYLVDTVKKNAFVLSSADNGACDPVAVVDHFGVDGLYIVIKAWTKTSTYWDAFYSLNTDVYNALGAAGYKFAASRIRITESSDKPAKS